MPAQQYPVPVSIHRHNLIRILSVLGDRLIINIIIDQQVFSIDLLIHGPDGELCHHRSRRRGHYLVALIDGDIEGATVIIIFIIPHHRRFITLRQIAYDSANGRRHDGIASRRRDIVTTVVIIIPLTADGDPQGIAQERRQKKSDRVPAGPPIIGMIRMIGIGMQTIVAAGMIDIGMVVQIDANARIIACTCSSAGVIIDPGIVCTRIVIRLRVIIGLHIYIAARGRIDTGQVIAVAAAVEIMVADIAAPAIDRRGSVHGDRCGSGPLFDGTRRGGRRRPAGLGTRCRGGRPGHFGTGSGRRWPRHLGTGLT